MRIEGVRVGMTRPSYYHENPPLYIRFSWCISTGDPAASSGPRSRGGERSRRRYARRRRDSHGEENRPTGEPGRSRPCPRGCTWSAADGPAPLIVMRDPAKYVKLRRGSMDRVHSAMCSAHDGWLMANAVCGAPRGFPNSEWRDSDITRCHCVVGCSLLCSRLRRDTKTPPDMAIAAGPAQRGEEHGH